jgi:hypothetical protein
VNEPTDLTTIRKKIEDGVSQMPLEMKPVGAADAASVAVWQSYTDFSELNDELLVMCTNAHVFNGKGTAPYGSATDLRGEDP